MGTGNVCMPVVCGSISNSKEVETTEGGVCVCVCNGILLGLKKEAHISDNKHTTWKKKVFCELTTKKSLSGSIMEL